MKEIGAIDLKYLGEDTLMALAEEADTTGEVDYDGIRIHRGAIIEALAVFRPSPPNQLRLPGFDFIEETIGPTEPRIVNMNTSVREQDRRQRKLFHYSDGSTTMSEQNRLGYWYARSRR